MLTAPPDLEIGALAVLASFERPPRALEAYIPAPLSNRSSGLSRAFRR